MVEAHTCNAGTPEAEAKRSLRLKACMVYIGSSRTARAITQRKPLLKNKQERRLPPINKVPEKVLFSPQDFYFSNYGRHSERIHIEQEEAEASRNL